MAPKDLPTSARKFIILLKVVIHRDSFRSAHTICDPEVLKLTLHESLTLRSHLQFAKKRKVNKDYQVNRRNFGAEQGKILYYKNE